ncbi:MAG: hypothetical protein ACR2HX_14350 [Pyrinomonadaceae bacterium]
MWRYLLAGFLIVMGLIEILLALNKRMRDELIKNSPVQSALGSPVYLLLAGVSALVIALGLLFYDRFV